MKKKVMKKVSVTAEKGPKKAVLVVKEKSKKK